MSLHRVATPFILAALWICAATAILAQEVRVLSGAHDGFSRLVVHMPSRVDWAITGDGDAREITFDAAGLRLNTSLVFDRIKGTRLSAVSPLKTGPGLKLAMKCACDVEVFWHGEAMLVIDVRDPAPIAQLDQAKEVSGDAQSSVAEPVGSFSAEALAPVSPMSAASTLATQHFNDQLEGQADALLVQTDLDQARRTLAREVARAASLGLVSASKLPASPTPMEKPHETKAELPPSDTYSDPPDINLHALTSADHIALPQTASDTRTASGAACIAPSAVAIATWGTDTGFAQQIGAGRMRLTEEFDRLTPQAALELARLYLYFGFGAEAAQVLHMAGAQTPEAEVAKTLAQIMERGHATNSAFAGQLECESDIALWSALSYETLPKNTAINTDAVLRALTALPVHIRSALGPQLVRKFTAAGQSRSAERTLRILDRNPAAPTANQTLAAAEIKIATGDSGPVDAALADVVTANTQTSAESLVHRIDTRLKTGRGVPQSMADLAGAFAQEQEGTKVGYELARSFIEATAAAGSFDSAFSEMKRLFPQMPDENQRHVVDKVLELLAANADDLTFLRHATRMREGADAGPHPSVGNQVARRLLDLGFTGLAQDYLRPPASGLDLENRRVMRAELDLRNGAPRQALVDLLGLSGANVNRLRAKANSQLGEHRAAHLLYLSAGEMDAALREALLAEDWQQANAIADQELVDVVTLGTSDADKVEPTGVLAQNRALLEASAVAREEVKTLLETRILPDAAGG